MPQRFSRQGVIYYNRNPLNRTRLNRTPRESREDLIPLVLIFFSVNTQTSRKLELLFVSLGSSSQRNSTVVFYALNCTYQKKKKLVMFTTLSPSLPPPPLKKCTRRVLGYWKITSSKSLNSLFIVQQNVLSLSIIFLRNKLTTCGK